MSRNLYEGPDESIPPTQFVVEDGVGVRRGVNEHRVCFTRAADWKHAAHYTPTVAVRHTTSSRRPGVDVTGVVTMSGHKLTTCEFCKRKRVDFGGPHSPQAVGDNEVSDCVGQLWRKESGTWRIANNG